MGPVVLTEPTSVPPLVGHDASGSSVAAAEAVSAVATPSGVHEPTGTVEPVGPPSPQVAEDNAST